MPKMPDAVPKSRPSLNGGARSLRSYRRVADFAIEMVLAGLMSAREGVNLTKMAQTGADLYMAEKQLSVHLLDVEDDHPLGAHGGAPLVPTGLTAGLEAGYDTIVPEIEDQEIRDAQAEVLAKGGENMPAGMNANPYPKGVSSRSPVPSMRSDANSHLPKNFLDLDVDD